MAKSIIQNHFSNKRVVIEDEQKIYEVGKAATSATPLMVRYLTRYISATGTATIRYITVIVAEAGMINGCL